MAPRRCQGFSFPICREGGSWKVTKRQCEYPRPTPGECEMLAWLYCSRYHTAERSLFRARHLTSPAAPTAAGPLQLTPSSWGDSAPSLGTAVVSLHHDTWLGHGFFSQASCPASMCHGGFAACSGFPNPSQVDLSSRVSPSPLTRAPTVGNSLTTGTGSQAAFSTERFHPKPGSTLQFHTLKAQSNPKAEMDATAATWVYAAMPQPFISSPRVRFCPRANAAQPPCPAF